MSAYMNIRWLCGLVLLVCMSFDFAQASTNAVTFVSARAGVDSPTCGATSTSACKTLSAAISRTNAGGQVTVLDSGEYGGGVITASLAIVNNSSGTASICCAPAGSSAGLGQITIAAGASGIVTLRGLTFNGGTVANTSAILINNAQRVTIEKCLIANATAPAIVVNPGVGGQPQKLASSMDVKIQDTTVSGSAAGVKITSVPSLAVNVAITASHIDNNSGGGVRADSRGGGTIAASIADSTLSHNAANGVVAFGGGSGSAKVNVSHDEVVANGQMGIESNGGTAAVLVGNTTVMNNVGGAISAVSGGKLLSYGTNRIAGSPGTGFTGSTGPQ
jgi:hypothetical protein